MLLNKKNLILCAVIWIANLTYAQAQHVDGILAVVGEKIILRSDLETEKAQLLRTGGVEDTQAFVCAMFEKLIIKQMMLNQAELDSLPLDDERVEQEIENRLRYFQQQAGSQAELEKYLGKTISEYKEDIRPKMRDQLLIQEMERKITENIKVSPQEVKQFFDTIPKDSIPIIPTEVSVAQLIIDAPISAIAKEFAKNQLEDIRKRILKGESFEKLARAYSEDPGSKDNGGLLPEFGRGDMVPEFERMAFKLKADSISLVFETDYGFHLMKLIQRKGERVIARHILIRPLNTTTDFIRAQARADSVYQLLKSKTMDWCNAVKKYQGEDFGDKGNCGFLKDETTGSQKILFEVLPNEIKMAVEKMQPGDITKPAVTATPDGRQVYRIIYLKDFIPPHQANLDQDYGRIQLEAENMKKQKAIEAWVEKTKKLNYIRLNTDFMACPELKKWENQN
ncbi:MAG: peptidylprolyl isomerase [Bacteroidetes bacterium]|nr:peptidylprolyl isomerase [Bacteroidota bacterium]